MIMKNMHIQVQTISSATDVVAVSTNFCLVVFLAVKDGDKLNAAGPKFLKTCTSKDTADAICIFRFCRQNSMYYICRGSAAVEGRVFGLFGMPESWQKGRIWAMRQECRGTIIDLEEDVLPFMPTMKSSRSKHQTAQFDDCGHGSVRGLAIRALVVEIMHGKGWRISWKFSFGRRLTICERNSSRDSAPTGIQPTSRRAYSNKIRRSQPCAN